ncbi:hypothetical protein BCR36DRAFT_586798 [Piromyces finnis]|uniref:chitin synthase n=1 Tax=Piromyces finnis TaxID=1754191 RepID=A0A1Y1UXQ8_9FUNG|nr:hypothetical protein BCR36DRAFT_586798 [Piromyces finnis]|eukprot:ORX43112.1 hypothetical protein BCR36DRAFT_586798 [Piromyces finnis]
MSGYPTNGPIDGGYPQDGRRPVIINAYPNNGNNTIRRNQTLSRPDRQPTLRRPLLRTIDRPPPAARAGATSGRTLGRPNLMAVEDDDEEPTGCWTLTSKILTFWAIPPVRALFGVGKNKDIIQAWREKLSLCIIIFCCWLLMGFFTIGIQPLFCPDQSKIDFKPMEHDNEKLESYLHYKGQYYSFRDVNKVFTDNEFEEIPNSFAGSDITPLFRECPGGKKRNCSDAKILDPCEKYVTGKNECKITANGQTYQPKGGDCFNSIIMDGILAKSGKITYKWEDIERKLTANTVYNGIVLKDIDNSINNYSFSEEAKKMLEKTRNKDGTRYFEMNEEYRQIAQCLIQSSSGGYVGKETVGCMFSQIITMVMTIAILGVVLTRFVMAIVFSWFVSSKLVQGYGSGGPRELYTICLVTAYSEGEEGIRCTLNSLATTTYPDKKQLLFVIADGIIMGSGNDRSTPDICTSMIIEDPKLGKAEPKSYFAIADGAKQHNMARAHAGYYIVDGHRVPAIVVVKCGTPAEASGAKPGNRGKRDSQLLLMNFLSRVTFDDRMTPLDYDLFKKIQHLCGVTPDKFEIVLMVDADTKVLPTSLSYLISAMVNDPLIMGVCGETRIANKTTSWVTWIQVFEYYISHHLGKCFESLFGGVTCLPGCFCMYRIKAPKQGSPNIYVPVLANPDIVEDYSENIVDTLHKKNLLLLGEDRFLTTLMLRTFPKRKMIFVPQALCKTIVPDEFKVLLSQRRRWINSTVHNLMELVLVRDLCGTFCFSMQFVVGMELFGTAVLPAAIVFTVYLLVDLLLIIYKAQQESQTSVLSYVWEHGPVVPLIMLFCVLGLPGVLVMLTSQKVIYVLWMFVYLFGLPVWNFILPVYAYWHFDDFSWGETRKVEGDNGDDHSKKEGVFDASSIPLKRWHEYEKLNRQNSITYGSPMNGPQRSPMNGPQGSPMNGPQRSMSNRAPLGPRPGGSPQGPPQGQRPFIPTQPGPAVQQGQRPPFNNIPPRR